MHVRQLHDVRSAPQLVDAVNAAVVGDSLRAADPVNTSADGNSSQHVDRDTHDALAAFINDHPADRAKRPEHDVLVLPPFVLSEWD